MKKLTLLTILGLMGCGGSFYAAPLKTNTVHWTDNGNPGVPVCGAVHQNCIYQVQLLDKKNNRVYTVSASQTSIAEPNPRDSYSIRTVGFDGSGKELDSVYIPVP